MVSCEVVILHRRRQLLVVADENKLLNGGREACEKLWLQNFGCFFNDHDGRLGILYEFKVNRASSCGDTNYFGPAQNIELSLRIQLANILIRNLVLLQLVEISPFVLLSEAVKPNGSKPPPLSNCKSP